MAYLTITNPNLQIGEVLYFTWGGFNAAFQVWVGVVGGGGSWFDGQSGSAGFQLTEPPGDYTLEAYDDLGEVFITAPFTITAVSLTGWMPMLAVLISSGQLNDSVPQSAGWSPMLTALVSTGVLNFSSPQSFGWSPMLTHLIDSGTLKKYSGTDGNSSTPWLLAAGIVGGAVILAMMTTKSQKSK